MVAGPFRPTSFTDEPISTEKLNILSNNDQWLFENTPRIRYDANSVKRDSGVKMLVGKAYQAPYEGHVLDVFVYFGSFFSAGCKPVVTATHEITGPNMARFVSIRGYGGEIDGRGFVARVHSFESITSGRTNALVNGGWVNWQAVGY